MTRTLLETGKGKLNVGTIIDFKTRQEVTAAKGACADCPLPAAASKIYWITQQAIAEHSLGCELEHNASDQPFQSTCTWESGCTTCPLKNAVAKIVYLAISAAGTPEMTEHLQKK